MEERVLAADFAGHCNESTAWKILKEVSDQLLLKKEDSISPFRIEVTEGGDFSLSECPSAEGEKGFEAPEAIHGVHAENSLTWSMGASLFYIVMGCQVMNGKGGTNQHPRFNLLRPRH